MSRITAGEGRLGLDQPGFDTTRDRQRGGLERVDALVELRRGAVEPEVIGRGPDPRNPRIVGAP